MNETMDAQCLSRRILDVTQQMSSLAQTGCWDEIFTLSAERQQLLETLFPSSSSSASSVVPGAELQEMIAKLLAADRSLLSAASAVRDETLNELDSHLFKQKAVGAYQAQS